MRIYKIKNVVAVLAPALLAAGLVTTDDLYAITAVDDSQCNAKLEISVSGAIRSSTTSSTDCQDRGLTSASGFALSTSNPAGGSVSDSLPLVGAGGELYEAYVDENREAAVILTPNRALMMSRTAAGDGNGVNWNLGLAVQPVASSTNAWLTGTYSFLRANRETRVVDSVNQSNAALSQIFDPVTLRIAFDGNSGCTVSSYSSWFSYALTTDPAGAFSQPDGNDYGLHQAVYAGSGATSVHEDSNLTFTDCDYVLGADGKLLVTYSYNDGDAQSHVVENAYYVSSDMRYIVSTVNSASDLYRGFELGVRVKTIAGTQDERNDGLASTFLFNASTVEWQGATGVLSEPDNEHRNNEKSTQCMGRGALVLSTNTSATAGWNTCTLDITSTCSVRGEEGETPSIAIEHYTQEGSSNTAAANCRFQVASNGSVNFEITMDTAEGLQTVSMSGAVADNNQTLTLRGKYVGSSMANPSDTNAPERTIKNDLMLMALVGVKYTGSLTADADSDTLTNFQEFTWSSYVASVTATVKNDYNADGQSDVLFINTSTGGTQYWQGAVKASTTYPGTMDLNYSYKGSGDFDGDGSADIFFTRASNNGTLIWNGAVKSAATYPGTSNAGFSVVAVCDVTGDTLADVVWHNASTGGTQIWPGGVKAAATYPGTQNTAFSVAACSDFDGDGSADIFWRNNTTGGNEVWLAASKANKMYPGANTDLTWTVAGAGDMNGNLNSDLVWHKASSGATQVWEGGLKSAATYPGTNTTTFTIKAIADYDGDGSSDIFWSNNSTNGTQIWPSAVKASVTYPGTHSSGFTVQK